MLKLDDKELKRFERDLKTFGARAFPFATKNTVNTAAFRTRKAATHIVSNRMTLRNRHTIQSIRVEQTKTLRVERQAAIVGSTAKYMLDQEFGAVHKGKPIATSYAAGQGMGVQPRTRLPRKANRMQNIQLKKQRYRGNSRKQRNLVAIKEAAASGRKLIFLDLGRRQGIFRVVGGKKRPKIDF